MVDGRSNFCFVFRHDPALGVSDIVFQADADKLVYFVQRTLGAPVVDSELDLRQIWTQLEAATVEYSQTINSQHARNIMIDMLGQGTGSLSGSEQVYPLGNSVEYSRNLLAQYSNEIGAGSTGQRWLTASITVGPDANWLERWKKSRVQEDSSLRRSRRLQVFRHFELR
jgi:hypothetical protein